MKIKSAEFLRSAVNPSGFPAAGLPEVALAGRSNVGKSSLINTLVNRKSLARTSKTPGCTRTINFFIVNGAFYLVDLPGYGYANVPERERENWREMVEGYLEGRDNLRGLLLLVDSRHPLSNLDIQMGEWIKYAGIPSAVVATKADKLSRSQLSQSVKSIKDTLLLGEAVPVVPFSAKSGQGREEVLKIIGRWVFGEKKLS